MLVRIVQDVAGHNFSVWLNSNNERTAIIAKQCLQIRSLIFRMILPCKQQLECFFACDRRTFVGRNERQFRGLIVAFENTVHLRVGRARLRCAA